MTSGSKQLIDYLDEAIQLLRSDTFNCLWSTSFDTAEQFAKELEQLSEAIQLAVEYPQQLAHAVASRNRARLWFLPTSDWNEIVGGTSGELGQAIYEAL